MKKLAFLLTLALAASAHAQATPGSISFVARLADNGTPITGSHDLVLSLFDASTAGNSVWTETRTGVTIPSDGLLYLDLGSVTPLDATVFSGSKRYLEVTIDGQITTPRIVIESTPYAIRSGEAAHSSDSDTLGTHAPSFFQARVSNACASGSAIASIDATGGVMCQPVPSYTATAGGGLLLTGSAFSVDPTVVQSRVSGVCNSGAIETILQNGTVTCLTAGTGLAFSTGQFTVDFATTQHAITPCAAGAVLSKADSAGNATCVTAGTGLTATASSWAVDTTAIQKRVTGTCSSGAIQSIAADGTVTCGGSSGAAFATVAGQQQTNGTTYGSLGGGPAVTATIGASGTALVTITATITPTLGNTASMGFSVDTTAASDTQSLEADTNPQQASATYVVTGLTAGSHTFTAKYRVTGGGNAQFANRSLIVIPQ
jgi:hypothetical protein